MNLTLVRIFVSSTWIDLQPERQAIEAVLQRLRETKFIGMEYFGSRDEDTRRASLDEVDASQAYIGIFAGRYGSGITEAEYRRARDRDLPCFIYIKEEATIASQDRDTTPHQAKRLASLKDELCQNHTVTPFRSPDDLAAKIATNLHNWLFNFYLRPALEQACLLGDEAGIRSLTEPVRDEEALRTVLAHCGMAREGDLVQSLLALGNRNVINIFLQGITALPTDYAIRIQNFLIEYLGTPDHPVPFGGRKQELAYLNRWLNDDQSPPYLLLAAPAGRGKSALLVHWSRQLLTRHDVAIVFFPISIRFRTNLSSVIFSALTARLASLHGDKIPGGPDTSVEIWRGLMTDYLSRPLPDGKTLLLIVDGIDEAADWEPGPDLFPFVPPPGVRILLSARYRAGDVDASSWLRALGWDRPNLACTPNLYPLTVEGVADVLQHMSFPLDRLGVRVDIVTELHRLSEGDPLIVRLYVDDLWTRGEAAVRLQPDDLYAIRPGIDGYFARWWDDQRRLWGNDHSPLRELAVQSILSLLSCALGPLYQEDVLNLAPSEAGLNTFTLEETLTPLKRFVIGDGRQQGYVLSHPRLAMYFYEQLSRRERQDWERRFLDWGSKTLANMNDNQLAPDDVSPYIVRYYGAHAERARQPPDVLLLLVSNNWRLAWEKLEGSYTGFLKDVDRAWRTAERFNQNAAQHEQPASYLGSAIRCALCFASVKSLAGKIPAALMVALVDKGLWTQPQGLAYARQVPDPAQRLDVLAGLVTQLPEPLQTEAVNEALEAIQELPQDSERAEALTRLIPSISPVLLERVFEMVRAMALDSRRADIIEALAPQLPETLLDEVLDMIWEIRNTNEQIRALASVAPSLPGPMLDRALEVARKMPLKTERAQVLTSLVPFLPKPSISEAVHEILEMCFSISLDAEKFKVQLSLLPYLSEDVRLEIIHNFLKSFHELSRNHNRTYLLYKIVPHLPLALIDTFLEFAQRVTHESEQVQFFPALMRYLPETYVDNMLAIVDRFTWEKSKIQTLIPIVPCLPVGLKSNVINTTLELIRSEPRQKVKFKMLVALIPNLEEALRRDILHEALDTAQGIAWDGDVPQALVNLVKQLPELEQSNFIDEQLHIIQRLPSTHERIDRIVTLAPYISESLLDDILARERSLLIDNDFTWALAKLSPYLSETLLEKILNEICTIGDTNDQIRTCMELIPFLPQPLLDSVLDQARPICDASSWARTLVTLAPRLSEPLLQEAIDGICKLKDLDSASYLEITEYQLALFTSLIPHLPASLLDDIVRRAQANEYGGRPVHTLTRLAPHMPEPFQHKALCAALELVRMNGYAPNQSEELLYLAPHMPEGLLEEVIQIAETLGEGPSRRRVETLVDLAPHLPEPRRTEALRASLRTAHAIEDTNDIRVVVEFLASHLPDSLRPELIQIAHKIKEDYDRSRALRNLALNLAEPLSSAVFQTSLETALSIQQDSDRIQALRYVIPHLSEPLQLQALYHALNSRPESPKPEDRARLLLTIAPHVTALLRQGNHFLMTAAPDLPELVQAETFRQTLQAILLLDWNDYENPELLASLFNQLPDLLIDEVWKIVKSEKAHVLIAVIPYLPDSLQIEAAQKILGWNYAWTYAQLSKILPSVISLLIALIPRLSESLRTEASRLAMDATRHLQNEEFEHFIRDLVPLLSEKFLIDYLADVKNTHHVFFLTKMIPHLPPTLTSQALSACLRVINVGLDEISKSSELHQVSELVKLASCLPLPHLEIIFQRIKTIRNEANRAQFLVEIAQYLPEPLLCEALRLAQAMRHPHHRERTLVGLAPRISESFLEEALAAIQGISDTTCREQALSGLTSRMTVLPSTTLCQLWQTAIRDFADRPRQDFMADFRAFVPILHTLGGDETITETAIAIREIGQWWQ